MPVVQGNCVDEMATLPAGTFDAVFADPPWNIGYEYDHYQDRMTPRQYTEFAREWITQAVRVLKPGGSFFLVMGDEYVAHHKLILDDTGMEMRNWLIWNYTFGTYCTRKFGRCHAHVLYYVKDGSAFTFNADAVSIPSDRQIKYNDSRANPAGKIPPDVWTFSRVCGTFRDRTAHPCQLPEKLVERCVLVSTNPGNLVIDPFAGSGTTGVVCKKHGRKFIGIEMSDQYAADANDRIADS